ncbi:MAG: acyltransferase [Clostridia bacterium]|nr:acyltransferase [Clostridia bacterium]
MSERRQRIPELDGLRVLMIFIVSWYHIWQQSWLRPEIGSYSLDYLVRSGYIWVDGTVLLSSFLLYLPYAKAKRQNLPAPDTRAFYYRRARRILPGYYFILLATLLIVALPWKLYDTPQFMVKDLATHLTFTFPFFRDTYMFTPLGAACWTLAIEVQAYALFPLIARSMMKKPALTGGIMCAVCFGFRAWCLWALSDYSMVVNQLINFLDVYVAGMLAAAAYVRLSEKQDGSCSGTGRYVWQVLASVFFVAAFVILLRMLRFQATSGDFVLIQRRQMIYRPVYALCFTGLMLSAPFALKPLRRLLGNPVTKFLGGISMNYYLIHQTVIVHLKRLRFPPSISDTPNTAGEQPWQNRYTLLSFGISLLLAILVTYVVEKPAARLLDRLRTRRAARQQVPAEEALPEQPSAGTE